MNARRISMITAAGLTVAGGAGAAIAATAGDDAKQAEETVLRDAAEDLEVSTSDLRKALRDATAAQLDRQLDRAVRRGDLTEKQAAEIKSRRRRSGRVLGLGFGAGHGPGLGHRFRGEGPGFWGRFGGPGPLEHLAKALGISRKDLVSQLRDGKTISRIAEERGKSLDQVKRALRTAAKARLERAVKRGDLTDRQAKAILRHLEEHIDRLGSARFFGPPLAAGGRGDFDGPGDFDDDDRRGGFDDDGPGDFDDDGPPRPRGFDGGGMRR